MGKGLLWVILYVVALMIPTVLLMLFFPGSDDGFLKETGKNFRVVCLYNPRPPGGSGRAFQMAGSGLRSGYDSPVSPVYGRFRNGSSHLPPHSHRRGQFQVETSHFAQSALVRPPREGGAPPCPGQCFHQPFSIANRIKVRKLAVSARVNRTTSPCGGIYPQLCD